MTESKLNLQAPWEEVKEKLKEVNVELTDEDLAYEPGQEDALLQRLSKKLRKDPADIKALIESVSSTRNIAS
jgi:hypothetical protein